MEDKDKHKRVGSVNNKSDVNFDKICRENKAIYFEGLGNPVKVSSSDSAIMYCLSKNEIFEVLLDLDTISKISLNCTWSIQAHGDLKHRVISRINGKNKLLHRLIKDCPRNMVIDHINHNTLDNRKENLRIVTQKINSNNRSTNKKNISKLKHLYIEDDKNDLNGFNYVVNIVKKFKDKKTAEDFAKTIDLISQHFIISDEFIRKFN
jgi:hypothetical protein